MVVSFGCLLNHENAAALVDKAREGYPDDEPRGMEREQAIAVILAVLGASGVRSDSFASAYAYMSLYEGALKLKGWTWDDQEAALLEGHRRECGVRQRAWYEAQGAVLEPFK